MTDYKQLCAELVEQLDDALDFTVSSETMRHMKLLTRKARAALAEADGPAVPEGREPAAVAGEPSDELVAQWGARWGTPNLAEIRSSLGDAPAEALAARPLLEKVARLGDRIGANSVGEIMAISSRAAAWLEQNPPGQPVAIEPRGCPAPGACSCVEPAPPAAGEVGELVAKLRRLAPQNPLGTADPTITRAADLLEQRHPTPVPVKGEAGPSLALRVQRLESMRETEKAALLDAFRQIDELKHRIDFQYFKLCRLEDAIDAKQP